MSKSGIIAYEDIWTEPKQLTCSTPKIDNSIPLSRVSSHYDGVKFPA
jgi:hypothetical protein